MARLSDQCGILRAQAPSHHLHGLLGGTLRHIPAFIYGAWQDYFFPGCAGGGRALSTVPTALTCFVTARQGATGRGSAVKDIAESAAIRDWNKECDRFGRPLIS